MSEAAARGGEQFGASGVGPGGEMGGTLAMGGDVEVGGSVAATGPPQAHRRSRTVLWASVGAAAVLAALFAVIVSARPSSQVLGKSQLLGEQAPPISGPGLSGGHYSLAEFRGKWVLVNFMATWCVPCRQEMPQLLDFSRQHARNASAVVLAVAYDPSNAAELRNYLLAEGATWPAVDDPQAPVSYGISGLPSSFLIAPNGTVVAYVEGGVRASELDRLMSEAASRGIAS